MALTTAAFDQPVSLLFMDEGVYQLLPKQRCSTDAPVMADWLGALSLYGVEAVWVDSASWQRCGTAMPEPAIPVRMIAASAIAELIAAHDAVITD